MENTELVDLVRKLFVKVLVNDKVSLIDTLNQDGFPTKYSISNDDLTLVSLQAMQISDKFQEDLSKLMLKQSKEENFKNFASYQPDIIDTVGVYKDSRISTNDMTFEAHNQKDVFIPSPLFVDNCKNCNK